MVNSMVDRISNSPSRIPVPVKAPSHSLNGGYTATDLSQNFNVTRNANYKPCRENGAGEPGFTINANPSLKKEKGFETFVMTGDMIIKTTSPPKSVKKVDNSESSHSRNSPEKIRNITPKQSKFIKLENADSDNPGKHIVSIPEPQLFNIDSEVPRPSRDSTGTKDSKETLSNSSFKSSDSVSSSSIQSVTDKRLAEVVDTSPDLSTSNEELLTKDPQPLFIHEDESSSDSKSDVESEKRPIAVSKSAEKIIFTDSRSGPPLVRTSKSHENYLQGGGDITLVNIDIDDDSLAYSMDVLSYEQSATSLDKLSSSPGIRDMTCRSVSAENSPERKTEKNSERVFMPGFISIDEPRVLKTKTKESKPKEADSEKPSDSSTDMSNNAVPVQDVPVSSSQPSASGSTVASDTLNDSCVSADIDFTDLDSLYTQPCIKESDRPSASRLAKRLFFLDGFKKSDVSRHLSKKNEFSTLVAEEYLKFFSFNGDALDVALRKFLKQFSLIGETQERERVLAHFSKHYLECNPESFNSEDACHTLTCAIMLLNSDLYGQNIGRKMTCSEFIENLSELNDGENFVKDTLKSIYQSIKTEPLEWAVEDEADESEGVQEERRPQTVIDDSRLMAGVNPFLTVPDPNKAAEHKKGYVMRKCCMDADGRRTPFGKRGWKMYFATLRDMILYLHKDDHGFKKGNLVESAHNAVRIHHALATKATDYTKKQHVFRLQTADGAEYLFQTSDSKELQNWIDTINWVAASLSAPPLPGAVGSQAKFQRPLLPSSYTRLNLRQQLCHHEDQVRDLESQLQEHRKYPPEKGSKARVIHDYTEKQLYLENELKRFKTYGFLLQSKMATYPELEPSLAETIIGEVDEQLQDGAVSGVALITPKTKHPVQRSLSDRYSYRAAIYKNDLQDFELV